MSPSENFETTSLNDHAAVFDNVLNYAAVTAELIHDVLPATVK